MYWGVSKLGSPTVSLIASGYWAARSNIFRMPDAGYCFARWEMRSSCSIGNISRAPGAPVPKAGTPNAQQAVPYFAALSFTHSSGMALAAASLVGSHLPDFSRVR